jgi:hypothetical protein
MSDIKHCGLIVYLNILTYIKFGVTGQETTISNFAGWKNLLATFYSLAI